MTAAPADPVGVARSLHAALEVGRYGEELRDLFTPGAVTIEHPNLLKPRGARMTLEEMLAASAAGAGLLRSQRYAVQWSAAVGTTAVLTLTWTGVLARDAGPLRAGQELVAHIAQVVETEGDRIASIETFDCYEPFPSS
jgi:hypothetical protein